jgi:hypothetical protein
MLGALRTFQQRAGAPLLPNCAKAPPMRHASGRSMVAVKLLALLSILRVMLKG